MAERLCDYLCYYWGLWVDIPLHFRREAIPHRARQPSRGFHVSFPRGDSKS